MAAGGSGGPALSGHARALLHRVRAQKRLGDLRALLAEVDAGEQAAVLGELEAWAGAFVERQAQQLDTLRAKIQEEEGRRDRYLHQHAATLAVYELALGEARTLLATFEAERTSNLERITALIDITPYAKEGEKLEDTAQRVAASFAVLGATMKTADQAIAALRGELPDVADELARSIDTMEQQGQDLWNQLQGLNGVEKLTDIEEIANAEQQLHDLIVARYQMEMKAVEGLATTVEQLNSVLIQTAQNIANHADLITSAGMAIGDLTASVINLAGAMPTVAGKLNALQAAINLWGVQAQRGIAGGRTLQEIQAEGAGLGPVIRASFDQAQAITDPTQRLQALNQVLATLDQAMQQGIANVQSFFAAQREAAQAAAQQRLGYLEAERAFVEAEATRRQQVLSDERSAIQAQISVAEEAQRAAEQARDAWQSVADSVRKQLLDLRLGDTAPPDAMGQLDLARSEFTAALADFRAGGGPESASLVQEMVARVLGAGQNVFTRPSNEWASLFAEMTAALEEVGVAAAAQATLGPGEQAMIDVRELQARLVEIDTESADIQRQLGEKLAQLQADQARIGADLTATLAELSTDETRALEQVRAAAAEDARAIAQAIWDTSQLVAQQAQQAAAQLQAILGEGVSYEQFMAQKNQDMAAALTVVRDDVRALLDETIRQGIARFVPGASYDVGSWNVPRTETALVTRIP